MRSVELVKRNLKEVWRDPLSLGLTIFLPVALLLILQGLEGVDEFFSPTMLAPGIVLFGFVMLMFSSAMILSKDRETALFARLLTAPLRSSDFVAGYSLPFLAVAIVQGVIVFAVAAVLGLESEGSIGLVLLVLLVMAFFFIGLGMILGSMLKVAPLSGAYSVVLLLTIFAGTWFNLDSIGGPIQTVENLLPFTHALDAARDVLTDGAGLGSIATDLYWITGYTFVVIVLAGVTFRGRMLE